jgi:hypothetical protein
MNKQKIIIIAMAILLVVGAGVWYWQIKLSAPLSFDPDSDVSQKTAGISLGGQIVERTQHPFENKFPETNPLKQIAKNPF